jgi:hypothetical protein
MNKNADILEDYYRQEIIRAVYDWSHYQHNSFDDLKTTKDSRGAIFCSRLGTFILAMIFFPSGIYLAWDQWNVSTGAVFPKPDYTSLDATQGEFSGILLLCCVMLLPLIIIFISMTIIEKAAILTLIGKQSRALNQEA